MPAFEYRTNARLDPFQFNENEVLKVLTTLKTSSATGPDGLGNFLLKQTGPSICKPLSRLFNFSLSAGAFPVQWKKSNTCPVHKKSDMQLKSNYRPISLLCNVSKIFERLVYNTLYEYLMSNNLLTRRNSGFVSNDSTINQLISIVHKIYNGLELSKEARMVFLDISKAFDRVWHHGLLFKLRQLGITPPVIKWFDSYLSNRQQRVVIQGQCSSWSSIEAGVPQGSILGPLLFLVYINDIVDNITCDIRLFADDTSIIEIITDPAASGDRINIDLGHLSMWGRVWRMTFSAIKSLSVLFSCKRNKVTHPPLYLGGSAIPEATDHTHLGITLSHDLKWHLHINRIVTKASKRLSLLKRLKFKLSRKTLEKLYLTMIRPILEYGCVLFDNCTQELADLIEGLQYEAARICTGARKYTSRARLLAELGWEPLHIRRHFFKLVHFYKIINKLSPPYLYDLLPNYVIAQAGRPLRNSRQLRHINCRTTRYFNSFLPSSVRLWNDLPDDIKESPSLSLFKLKLSKLLFFRHEIPNYFAYGDRFSSIIHTQLRLGQSGLNSHLFEKNIVPSAACSCNFPNENICHFFLYCPLYESHRRKFLRSVASVLAPGAHPNLLVDTAMDRLVEIILSGSSDLPDELNTVIFAAVQLYITETRRFINE